MHTPNRIDTSTLGWVRNEIDQTLDQAREALGQFVRDGEDMTPLRLLANSVHQVAGTLQMVELDGAAQLAQETESLASAVAAGRVEVSDTGEIGELLDEGLTRLSGYMQQLAAGAPDRPVDNLGVINALRRARDAGELDPYSFFHPDLEIYPTREEPPEDLDADTYAARIRALRRDYQSGLLRWLRDQQETDAWDSMAGVVERLFELSRFHASLQIWWVARAYLDALRTAGLRRDDPRKHTLAQLDQLMRKLIEDSEAALARQGQEKLVRYMLYHVGQAEVETESTLAVRRLFDLDNLLGTGEAQAPAAPDREALEALGERMAAPLRSVQAFLEEFARNGRAAEGAGECEPKLRELEQAAEEHGVEELARISAGVRRMVFAGGAQPPSEEAMLTAARALLFIEQTLERPAEASAGWRAQAQEVLNQLTAQMPDAGETPDPAIESREIDTDSLDAHELRRLVAAVGDQIEHNLKLAERSLEQFSLDQSDADSLSTVARSLEQVHGAVRMLGQHKLCDLLETALTEIRTLESGERASSAGLLDALAVAIGTSDACVKGLERDVPNLEILLDRAMRELETASAGDSARDIDPVETLRGVRESFDAWTRDNEDYDAFRELRAKLRDVGALAQRQDRYSLRRIAHEMTNLLDIVTEDPASLTDEVERTLRRSMDTLNELAAPLDRGETAPAAPAEAAGTPQSPGSDEIVRETFVAEAKECLDVIAAGLETLRNDPEDHDALTDARRNLHTIKGSGRMAAAGDIAELAWIGEDLLNRCLDGEVAVSEPVVDLVGRIHGEVAALLERGLGSAADLESWRASAAALGDPASRAAGSAWDSLGSEPASYPAGDATEEQAAAASMDGGDDEGGQTALASIEDLGEAGHSLGAEAGEASGSPYSDNEVIKIFSREALSHIATIRDTIDQCNRRGRLRVGDDLLRATHTLQGNARSLHLVELSEACSALDDSLQARREDGSELRKEEMPLLDDLLVATAKVLDHLNRDRRFPDVVRQELSELGTRIRNQLDERRDPPAEDTAGLAGLELVTDLESRRRRWRGHQGGPQEAPDPAAPPVASGAADTDAPRGVGPEQTPADAESEPDGAPGLSPELQDVFVEEASDILSRFESILQQARSAGIDNELARRLKRELHTLKGSSRAAGLAAIGGLSHDAESMLEGIAGEASPPDDLTEVLEEVHDTLAAMVQGVESGRIDDPGEALVARLRGGREDPPPAGEGDPAPEGEDGGAVPGGPAPVRLVARDSAHDAGEQPVNQRPVMRREQDDQPPPGTSASAGKLARAGGRGTVRIQSNVLDKLVNYAGEVSISRSQLEEQLSGLKSNLNELRANVARFSDQVRELDIQADTQIRSRVSEEQVSEPSRDFDPLELDRYSRLQQLSRSLSESVDDLVTIQTGLNRFATQTEGVLSQQAMLNSELQDGLMSARMVPFNTLVPRLRHQARQTARELGKDIDFSVAGGELEVDRNILDQLSEALEHMIRNSLDHGIETAAERQKAGKPERGSLRIDCRQEGSEVVLRFSDDGRGLDVERIKGRAVEAGLLGEDSDLSDEEVIQLIVLSGFSTAESLTQLSGRGVGLDVVNDAARRLGGSLSLDNRPGEGVSFRLRLPLSLSITQAMFVRCGDQRFAIPLGAIETVMKAEPDSVAGVSKDGDPVFKRDDREYPLMDLTAVLGLESAAAGGRVPILLVRMGAREVAVRVDELTGTDEIVVKQLGDHLARLSGINGATVTGDGSVVIILDLADLWLAQERQPALRREAVNADPHTPRVMVVDDSLTVRKVTARNLGRCGIEVSMARDGMDALDQMLQARPDLLVVDIEMPRMDGFELTSRVREDVNYRDIPIIVITSRSGAKHRERAMELGANAYLTKPYQEKELLDQVNALLKESPLSTVQ